MRLPMLREVWARLVVMFALLAGCAAEGEVLPDWTIDVAGGAHGEHVTLPGKLSGSLPFAEVDYTLTTTLALDAAQRGRPATLVVDCFHGPLELVANGTPIPDTGEGRGGSYRFSLPATTTQGESLELVLGIHHSAGANLGFGVAPRIVDGADGDARSRSIGSVNKYLAIIALCMMGMLATVYLALVVLEGPKPMYLSMVVYGLTVTNVPLLQLGVFQMLFGAYGNHASFFVSTVNFISLFYLVHFMFELGPVKRAWVITCAAYLPIILLSMLSYKATVIAATLNGPLNFAVNGYIFVTMLRVARGRGPHRIEARLMLLSSIPAAFCIVQAAAWIALGRNQLAGVHPFSGAIAFAAVTQGLIIGRQHAARQRSIEDANRELQRQVAERSRELGEALAKLGQQAPAKIDSGRIIDGRYRVIDKLGAGGMGTVFEVERLSDQKRLALKTLRGHGDTDLMARFAREAQVAAELDHPNLVPVLDVGITDGGLFLVMPLLDGGSVEGQRAKFGDPVWATPVLRQIASGLAALHARDIVHRDLKPANVLLSGGIARIADFGLASLERGPEVVVAGSPSTVDGKAKLAHADTVGPASPDRTMTGKLNRNADAPAPALPASPAPALTRIGDVFGTPPYMAPELERGVHAVQPSSDVFAFGLIACELLTGQKAFPEPPLMLKLAGKPIPAPTITGLPPIVARCLDLDPARRPTAAELEAALA